MEKHWNLIHLYLDAVEPTKDNPKVVSPQRLIIGKKSLMFKAELGFGKSMCVQCSKRLLTC